MVKIRSAFVNFNTMTTYDVNLPRPPILASSPGGRAGRSMNHFNIGIAYYNYNYNNDEFIIIIYIIRVRSAIDRTRESE